MTYSPKILVNVALLLAAILLLLDFSAILYPPYTGFELGEDKDAGIMRVVRLDQEVAQRGLLLGDGVVAIRSQSGASLQMHPRYFVSRSREAGQYFESRSERIAAFDAMYRLLADSPVVLELDDGREVELGLGQARPLTSFSASNWALIILGVGIPVLAALVWAWQPSRPEAVYLLLSGLGFYGINFTASVSIYNLEMYFPPAWLHWLTRSVLDIGQLSFAAFGAAVLLYYPHKFDFADRVAKSIISFVILYPTSIYCYQYFTYASEKYPGFDDAQTYSYMFLFFAGVLYLCWLQFQMSKHLPVQRAQTLWLILAWTVGPGLYLFLRGVPVLLDQQPLLDSSLLMNFIISTTYFLVLIGVARFNLFQLERHIGQAYQWVLLSLCFFGLDFALIALSNLSPGVTSAIVLGAVLWGYLPIRQWLHQRYSMSNLSRSQLLLNEAVVQMVQSSLDASSTPVKTWEHVLKLLFKPGRVTSLSGSEETAVAERGQQLIVSSNTYSPPLLLEFADAGKRLFNNRDLVLASTLTLLFEKLYDVRDAYLAGQTQERSRIRRDLHDQIGHKLLSLIYTAKDNYSRTLAQETMSQLSELIQALKQEPINLDDLAVRVHSVCEDACSHAKIELEWENEILPGNTIKINSDQYLNILNILRELLSNTSKHSEAGKLRVAIGYGEGVLKLAYADDGSGFVQAEVKPGNGLFNLQLRAAELQASMHWQTEAGTRVQIEIPLATGESNHD